MRGLSELYTMNEDAIAKHKAQQEAYDRYRLGISMPSDLAIPLGILFAISVGCGIALLLMRH